MVETFEPNTHRTRARSDSNEADPFDDSVTGFGDAMDVIHRFTEHRVSASIPVDSRRGVDDALSRARHHPEPWRAIARNLGVTVTAPRLPRWRR